MRWGIKAFVAESYAEIFFGNCVALGLPCFAAAAGDLAALMDSVEARPDQELGLDVGAQEIRFGGGSIPGAIPDGPREQFGRGTWDALGQLLEAGEEIGTTARELPYISGFTPA